MAESLKRDRLQALLDPKSFALLPAEAEAFALDWGIPPLTHNRLDIAIKLAYLEARDLGRGTFDEKVYDAHIDAFSRGTFTEPGAPEKNSIARYKADFDDIVTAIQEDRFDPQRSVVPLAGDGSPYNGAHRSAASIFLRKPVPLLRAELPPRAFDYRYFRRLGMEPWALAHAATKLIEYVDNAYVALLWPAGLRGHERTSALFDRVIYSEDIVLNRTGSHNLLTEVYAGEPWLGPAAENYPGIERKRSRCFAGGGPLRVIAFQASSLAQVAELKDAVRAICGIGKHSVHITDRADEAVRLSHLLFNENARHFLNHAHLTRYPEAAAMLADLREHMTGQGALPSDYAVDGGLVLASYGLRPTRDADYITTFADTADDDRRFDNHASELGFHDRLPHDIIRDPALHFQYGGMKFVSLAQVARMKGRRRGAKDMRDLRLIEPLLRPNPLHLWRGWLNQLPRSRSEARARVRRFAKGVRGRLRVLWPNRI